MSRDLPIYPSAPRPRREGGEAKVNVNIISERKHLDDRNRSMDMEIGLTITITVTVTGRDRDLLETETTLRNQE